MNLRTVAPRLAVDPTEAPFGVEEVFYSRTDGRGVIRAGNAVFQRVCGHDWSGLIGAPHRIIRHPDTPRAVFWMLWQALKAGQPIGAYVKNLAHDGRHYWVFAVVLPMPDGYLSVRIKPTSAVFATIKPEYEALAAREKAEALTPEAGAAALSARLPALGFADYSAFMARALGAEMAARDTALGHAADPQAVAMAGIGDLLAKAMAEQKALSATFESLQSIPTNMRIVASRLEPAGGPISAISDNYKIASREILVRLRAFAGQRGNLGDSMAETVGQGLFLLGCARVQAECVRQFQNELPGDAPIDRTAEMAYLRTLESECAARARAGLTEAAAAAAGLARASHEIRRLMLGLDSIRVMGRVENGRLRGNSGGLAATLDQLDRYHADIKVRLEAIADCAEQIEHVAQTQGARAAA
ncbi:MAG: histidine kinase [Alphaproteobacteria bacterium HGW-Alphaproteobacteria-4]|nr:MAG: histidine kinase [Alphaproteobacteria bacterium HGW-Alphaproteobacteria-4]